MPWQFFLHAASKTAPFVGSLAGATGGAALGGIPGAAIGSTVGYGGIAYDWAADPDKKEMVQQISQGEIAEVIANQVAKQNTGLTSFLKDLQNANDSCLWFSSIFSNPIVFQALPKA